MTDSEERLVLTSNDQETASSVPGGQRPLAATKRDGGRDAHLSRMGERRRMFRDLFDFSRGKGLEIGPLDSSIATKDVADVRYVDVYDTDGTRAAYADDPNVLVELIPDIDFALADGARIRTLRDAVSSGGPYDWVIASHVIEHVPDVIGWLEEIAQLVVDGGALVLAVPDRRYCFDALRPPTTVGQALEAHELRQTIPSIRAVYDYVRSTVDVDTAALWRGERPPRADSVAARAGRLHDALKRVRAGEYFDCHVWTLTPQSFAEHLLEFRALDVSPWYVERLVEIPGSVEFHAVLRRLPRGQQPSTALVEEPRYDTDLPDWLVDVWTQRERVRILERRVRRLRRRNRTLEQRVSELEGSARMRVGRAVVGPISRLRRRIRPGR